MKDNPAEVDPADPIMEAGVHVPGWSHDELSSDHAVHSDIPAPHVVSRPRGRERSKPAPEARPVFVDDPVVSESNFPETVRRRLTAAKLPKQSKTVTASFKRKSVKSDDIFHRSLRGVCSFALISLSIS